MRPTSGSILSTSCNAEKLVEATSSTSRACAATEAAYDSLATVVTLKQLAGEGGRLGGGGDVRNCPMRHDTWLVVGKASGCRYGGWLGVSGAHLVDDPHRVGDLLRESHRQIGRGRRRRRREMRGGDGGRRRGWADGVGDGGDPMAPCGEERREVVLSPRHLPCIYNQGM